MSLVKSFSVSNGDQFLIDHASNSLTLVDCCLPDTDARRILRELVDRAKGKAVTRFISTHPDEDHFRGLRSLDAALPIVNFYCVKNSATKSDETDDFKKYRELRDSDKAFYVYAGCRRKWLNESDDTHGCAGLHFAWPKTDHPAYQSALKDAAAGLSPNNISPILEYHVDSAVFVWMGDLETDFMAEIADTVKLPRATVLFAPHHGRDSGKVPEALLKRLAPSIVVIGEAPSESLNYYAGYNTITQNSAGDIVFDCVGSHLDVFVSSTTYSAPFLTRRTVSGQHGRYIGSWSLP